MEGLITSVSPDTFSSPSATPSSTSAQPSSTASTASAQTSSTAKTVSMIALFDNEEIGSVSAYGAESNFIESVIGRVAVALKSEGEGEVEAVRRCLAKSFLLSFVFSSFFLLNVFRFFLSFQARSFGKGSASASFFPGHITRVFMTEGTKKKKKKSESINNLLRVRTDMAHALHPSFTEKHEDNHRPLMNSGPAIKTNYKQRYASTSETVFLLRRIAKIAGVPLQEFAVRNDMPCGSTSLSFYFPLLLFSLHLAFLLS